MNYLQYKLLIMINGSSNKHPNRLKTVNAMMNEFNGVRRSLFFKNIHNNKPLKNVPLRNRNTAYKPIVLSLKHSTVGSKLNISSNNLSFIFFLIY